jgi:hypothetical protein
MSAAVVLSRARRVLSPEEIWLVQWALAGQATGHEWCACGSCGELRLMDPPTPKGPRERCLMSFDCSGEMERIVKRPLTTERVKRALRECPYCGRVMSDREAAEQGACNDCYGSHQDEIGW